MNIYSVLLFIIVGVGAIALPVDAQNVLILEPDNLQDYIQYNSLGVSYSLHTYEETERKIPQSTTLFEWAIGGSRTKPVGSEDSSFIEEALITDRPDFTESSTTVGRDRIQIEMGYTYTRDRDSSSLVRSHSVPEFLIRAGLFAEWFELRVGQNFLNEHSKTNGLRTEAEGGEDTYLGIKLALTPQRDYLPEMAVILQSTVPTGAEDHSADEALPGVNWIFSWAVDERFSMGGSLQANKAMESGDHSYTEVAGSVAAGYGLTDSIGTYAEWYALFPSGANTSDTRPEHYLNGGFTYLFTPTMQIDIRAGYGLNPHADDFFTGVGFSVKF